VDLDLAYLMAEFAPVVDKPADQLWSMVGAPGRIAVNDDHASLPFEWDSTETGDQWLPAAAFDTSFVTRPYS